MPRLTTAGARCIYRADGQVMFGPAGSAAGRVYRPGGSFRRLLGGGTGTDLGEVGVVATNTNDLFEGMESEAAS